MSWPTVLAAVLLLGSASTVRALTYNDLIVFGDSLSDVGNTQHTTSTGFLGFFVPDTPGDSYFAGRFSNGPVWTEWLSSGLGLGTLTPERLGGDNFAFGGARTEGTDFATDIFIDDLASQVDNFVDNRAGDPNALYTMLIGANDLFQVDTSATQLEIDSFVTDATVRVRNALQSLYNDGARRFLVLNVPWLGLTPTYSNAPEGAVFWTNLAINYNSELDFDVGAFEAANTDATVFRVDTAGLLNDVITSATEFGFTNTTAPAAPGLDPGDNSYNDNLIVANPDEYLFWDGVHPTAAVHRLLGFAALRAVLPAGDYNYDGSVLADDLSTWKDAFGSRELLEADGNGNGIVDAGDYAVWRNNYLATLAAPGAASLGVPEPSGVAMIVVAFSALGVVVRRGLV